MSYIGSNYAQQVTTPAVDYFNGNGVTTSFQLTRAVTSINAIQVVVNNVPQNAREAYGITASNQIVFTSAPSAGTNNIYVIYDSQVGQVVTPGPGTVNTNALGSISNINSIGSNFTLQRDGVTALTVDQNQNIRIQNNTTFNTSLQLARVHVALTDSVRNTTLMNANNTNTLAVLSAPFGSPELTANAGAKWGMLFNGNGDFSTTSAGLATAIKSAGVYAVSEDTAAGYNRRIGLAIHTCEFDAGHREAMRISGAGHVTIPNQPVASVSYSGGDIAATAIIPLNAGAITRGGMTIASNRITVPVAGTYIIGFHHLGTNLNCQLQIRVNGASINSNWGANTQINPASAHGNGSVQNPVALGANDFIEFFVINATVHGNGNYNRMYAYLLG
jgi:hypothetical protein